jgi:lysozyme family protein
MSAPWPIDGADLLTQARRIVWLHEGGNRGTKPHTHPKDAGGRTRAGLTWRCYSEDFLRMKRGTLCPVEEFDALTLDEIVNVMLDVFAMRPNIWRIEDPRLRFISLDSAILFGAGRAVMFLQAALSVTMDGLFGPQTGGALARHPQIDAVRELAVMARVERHGRRVIEQPDQLVFLAGWLARCRHVLAWRPS